MPNYLINKTNSESGLNEVLLDIPLGKTYVTASAARRKQSRQKKGTCWYYVLNHLRARYGKDAPSDYPGRQVEIIVSAYRKRITTLQTMEAAQKKYLARGFSNRDEVIAKSHSYQHDPEEKDFWEMFLKQNLYIHPSHFSRARIAQLDIANAKDTLYKFGIEPLQALNEFLTAQREYTLADLSNLNSETLTDVANLFATVVMLEAVKRYQITVSSWNPLQDIDALITELRVHGALAVAGLFGGTHYDAPAHPISSQENTQRIFWSWTGAFRRVCPIEGMIHEVLIIGAKKAGLANDVYFIDPNDGDNRKIYTMPYSQLTSHIASVHNNFYYFVEKEMANEPFAFRADEKHIRNEQLFFKKGNVIPQETLLPSININADEDYPKCTI